MQADAPRSLHNPGRLATGLLVATGLIASMSTATPEAGGVRAAEDAGESAAASRRAPSLPDRIDVPPRVRQMVTVTAPRWSSTTGTLKAWARRDNGQWVLRRGPVPVVVGYNGWVRANQRRQSTGTTPAGKFPLPYSFGKLADPGGRHEYRRFDRNDWWPYEPRDPATYNVYQYHRARTSHWRPDKAERLWDFPGQYDYGMVVGFNLPSGIHYSKQRRQLVASNRADTSRGGGIFLHVRGNGLTAGCVAMSRPQMRWLVRWVRPGASPRVAMGPYSYIVRR